jgi:hypothetical protein
LCDDVRVQLVSVQYRREEYVAVELMGIADVVDISFTGSAENKSLLLVNENDVQVIDNLSNSSRSGGTIWEETSNGIY